MRICIDLDGTLCELKRSGQSYRDVEPLPGAVERLRQLRAAGHVVIITTARHMATCEANVGKVLQRVGKITLDWLEHHGFEYDEIHFGKPNAEVYIDDRGLRFDNWAVLTEDVLLKAARER